MSSLIFILVAPKFPTPVNPAFLLRLGTFQATVEDVVGDMECEHAKFMAMATLRVVSTCGLISGNKLLTTVRTWQKEGFMIR